MKNRILTLCSLLLAIAIFATGTLQSAYAQSDATPQAALSDSLTLDLNGSDSGTGYVAKYAEDTGPVAITSPNLEIGSNNGEKLRKARITLTDRPDKNLEILSADATGTNIEVFYSKTTGELRLDNLDTISNYAQVLRTVTYDNLSSSPDITDRIISFVLYDSDSTSDPVYSQVTINITNDAPILDNSADLKFNDILEDETNSPGTTVAAMLESGAASGVDPITDPDDNAQEGIAVIEVGNSNGTWQFSTNGGGIWTNFPDVSNISAVLLNPAARIRFIPKENFSGQANLTFRAWDQTSGTNGETGVNVSINGGTTAFSTNTESAVQNVLPINDLPVVDLNGALPGFDYSTGYMAGNSAVALTASDATIIDVDNNELINGTITMNSKPDGDDEQIAVDTTGTMISASISADGATITLSGAAPVADYQKVLRTLTYTNSKVSPTTGARTVSVRVFDGSDDSNTATSLVTVQAPNNAPVLDPDANMALTPIEEDNTTSAGNSVAEILASAETPPISDPDTNAQQGFAVVLATTDHGSWEYSVDGGNSWLPLTNLSNTSAVLLDTTARIRYVPNNNYFGDGDTLTVRAWDQTTGLNGSAGVDVSDNGGTTSYSSATAPISISVTPVNDPPELELIDDAPSVFEEGNPPVFVINGGLTIRDVDNNSISSATVVITNLPENEPDILDATTTGTNVSKSYNAATGTLKLTGSASKETYRSILRSLTFSNSSQDPSTVDRMISIVVRDAQTDSNTVTTTVQVKSINDAPELDLNGFNTPGKNVSAAFNTDTGSPIVVAPMVAISDTDDTEITNATVTIENPLNPASERLTAEKLDTNITISYADGVLTLTGRDAINNYARVLSTVEYANSAETLNRTTRILTFEISDGTSPSDPATARISFVPVYSYLPTVFGTSSADPSGEPNDSCAQSYPLRTNTDYSFLAEDMRDYYTFTLDTSANLTVELTNFAPRDGQIVLAKGTCENSVILGSNGDFSTSKTIQAGRQSAGTYFVLVINDGSFTTDVAYTLHISAE